MKKNVIDKRTLFAETPVPRALFTMAVPTIISQLINLIYNMVDAFFIGRTGNSYMMAATTITLTMVMMNVALSNLFGIGGGSLVARLMGADRPDQAKRVSAFSVYGQKSSYRYRHRQPPVYTVYGTGTPAPQRRFLHPSQYRLERRRYS